MAEGLHEVLHYQQELIGIGEYGLHFTTMWSPPPLPPLPASSSSSCMTSTGGGTAPPLSSSVSAPSSSFPPSSLLTFPQQWKEDGTNLTPSATTSTYSGSHSGRVEHQHRYDDANHMARSTLKGSTITTSSNSASSKGDGCGLPHGLDTTRREILHDGEEEEAPMGTFFTGTTSPTNRTRTSDPASASICGALPCPPSAATAPWVLMPCFETSSLQKKLSFNAPFHIYGDGEELEKKVELASLVISLKEPKSDTVNLDTNEEEEKEEKGKEENSHREKIMVVMEEKEKEKEEQARERHSSPSSQSDSCLPSSAISLSSASLRLATPSSSSSVITPPSPLPAASSFYTQFTVYDWASLLIKVAQDPRSLIGTEEYPHHWSSWAPHW